jgi:hypothetical protein
MSPVHSRQRGIKRLVCGVVAVVATLTLGDAIHLLARHYHNEARQLAAAKPAPVARFNR